MVNMEDNYDKHRLEDVFSGMQNSNHECKTWYVFSCEQKGYCLGQRSEYFVDSRNDGPFI